MGVQGSSNALAQAGCSATINGVDVGEHSSASDAITIDPRQPIEFQLLVPGKVGAVEVRIEAGPVTRTLHPIGDRIPRPGTSWTGAADASSATNLSVGLHKATVSTGGGCELTAWIKVEGNPFTTVAGVVASFILLAGLSLQLFGLIRGFRHKGGFKWALLGGIPTGLGACVLAQQFGATPITPAWVTGWTAPPVAIGGLLQVGMRMLSGGKVEAGMRGSERASSAGREAGDAGARPPVGTADSSAPEIHHSRDARSSAGVSESTGSPPPEDGATTARRRTSAEPPAAAEEATRTATRGGGRTSHANPTEPALAASEELRDPPRSAFALLDCPEVVIAAEPFELVVGLAAERQEGVSGGELVRPPASVGDYVLTIQLVADGFTLAAGESWRNSLAVTAEAPYPSVRLHLTPDSQDRHVTVGAVQAVYSVNGHTMGLAVRPLAVVRTAALAEAAAPSAVTAQGVEIAIPVAAIAADLTVRIQKAASESGGKLMWTFDSPHAGLDLPDAPVVTDIGDEPESFVRQLITGISVHEGHPGLHAYLTGVGFTIADNMPAEFWTLLRAVAELAGADSRPPTVFLLSEDPYVPWELAIVDEPLSAEAGASRFLGAQASVGRWVLAQRRPTLPPPLEVNVGEMAVVSGIYDQPGWDRLLDAEAEAAELCQRYGGRAVDAEPRAVLRCLGGDPVADLLHFSLHGVYDPRSTTDGLVLVDGSALDPFQVKGLVLKSSPFVFLNACQVGAGSKLLGDYAGMAESFLYAGASGVIAPLWSINDALARGVAGRFYEKAFAGMPPAAVLREEREDFGEDATSATALAYLYYGHPALRLKRP